MKQIQFTYQELAACYLEGLGLTEAEYEVRLAALVVNILEEN